MLTRHKQQPVKKTEEGAGESSSDDEFGFKTLNKKPVFDAAEITAKSEDNVTSPKGGDPLMTAHGRADAGGGMPKNVREYRRHASQPGEQESSSKTRNSSPVAAAVAAINFNQPKNIIAFNKFCQDQINTFDYNNSAGANKFPQFSSSSSEVSPLVTPRTGSTDHLMQRGGMFRASIASSVPRPAVPPAAVHPPVQFSCQYNQPYTYGDKVQNRRFTKDPRYGHNQVPFRLVATTQHQPQSLQQPQQPFATTGACSDSEAFEEKLKNVTNLDKKVGRRSSSAVPRNRHQHRNEFIPPPTDAFTTTRNSALPPSSPAPPPRQSAAVHESAANRKTTSDLYHERKALRQTRRDHVKASRGVGKKTNERFTTYQQHQPQQQYQQQRAAPMTITRCASEENVFNGASNDHQGSYHREAPPLHHHHQAPCQRSLHSSAVSTKIRRRHTLGSGDILADGEEMEEVGDSLMSTYQDMLNREQAPLPHHQPASHQYFQRSTRMVHQKPPSHKVTMPPTGGGRVPVRYSDLGTAQQQQHCRPSTNFKSSYQRKPGRKSESLI